MSYIVVFTGPMKCGKSTRLLEEIQREKMLNKRVGVFKPAIDTRFDANCICDRNDNKQEAILISNTADLLKFDYDVYCIDEFQFLEGIIDPILILESKNKSILVSGLNLTASRKPFGLMPDILAIADNVYTLSAICENCHNDFAKYSFCKVEKTGDILVGDDVYMPVCKNCYNKLTGEV